MNQEAAKNSKPGDATWFPVILSLAVYPGIGQWRQKRHNAGTFYFFVFTIISIMFCWMLFLYLYEAVPILLNALEGRFEEGQEFPPAMRVLKPLFAVTFVYLANAVDVLRGRSQLLKS